jgi:predicted PolB exonuclease-like 3'-5' exonuclease
MQSAMITEVNNQIKTLQAARDKLASENGSQFDIGTLSYRINLYSNIANTVTEYADIDAKYDDAIGIIHDLTVQNQELLKYKSGYETQQVMIMPTANFEYDTIMDDLKSLNKKMTVIKRTLDTMHNQNIAMFDVIENGNHAGYGNHAGSA